MLPDMSFAYPKYRLPGHSKCPGERRQAIGARFDFTHLGFTQFCTAVQFASCSGCSVAATLLNAVGNVICVRPKKQVVRVYALPVVALVKHVQSLWYRPVSEEPGQAMGGPDLRPIPRNTVAAVHARCCPIPTIHRFLNFVPKRLDVVDYTSQSIALLGAIHILSVIATKKLVSAVQAYACLSHGGIVALCS